jgi:hypothetical protein
LAVANDWTVNDNPDPVLSGRNAWRFGTALGPGADNSGTGDWYEVLVQDAGPVDEVWAREAATEAGLAGAPWQPGSDFGIDAAANFDPGIGNWQYELLLGPGEPGPGPLPPCWHWEWQQLDPRPTDGMWIPVFDGSVHHAPEPSAFALAALGLLVLAFCGRRRKRN